jgi:hypothetical protein
MAQMTSAQKTAVQAQRARLFDLEKTLELIEAGKIAAGGILQEIRDQQLFAVDPDRAYASFEQYTEQRWGFGKREADRKIDAFNQVQALRDHGVAEAQLPQNPWQARDIAVLVNKTDVATAARTWTKALSDSQDPQINPAGRLTGVFLKGYVDAALQQAGAARRQGTSRARAGSATQASNGTVVGVSAHTRRVSSPSSSGATPPPAPVGVAAPSTNGVAVVTPVEVNCEVLFELADDVRTRRLHLGNPLSRKPLLEGVAALLTEITAQTAPAVRATSEYQALADAIAAHIAAVA